MMNLLKFSGVLGMVAGMVSPALVTFAAVPAQVGAKSSQEMLISLKFPKTSDRGAPRRTAGGGSRGDDSSCTDSKMPLTALMPTRNNVGTTAAGNPSFFFFVPKTTAKQAEFVLVNEKGEDVYVNTFAIADAAGVVKVSLPETTALEVGKYHTWQFALICNEQDRKNDEFVQGFIRRSELSADMKRKLEKATPLEQAKIYANARVWNETVTILAQLRDSQPAQWEQLLKSVGLQKFASEPFAPCCTAKN
ncbi:DUF928 domain-containing protein [Microcoleus sp. FACHB-672]|uniref:DUF928 domain-containing protein n=1 Tax=Microcoleus sp. FACHB-672 TaxID=2692825 RepID=UPI00168757A6|nr:DUF928 domain-containing protein [Microcoleus sp. FACHB-672]MBD2042916.1 DUF928 domain-containing protein [Microcoleus sp. FACHB-672]